MSKTKYERESQALQILKALQRGRKLTCLDILREFACFSGKQRIYDLRHAGHNIEDEWVETEGGARVKRWFIKADERQLRLI